MGRAFSIMLNEVYSNYRRYQEDDSHFFFRRKPLKNETLLSDARKSFLEDDGVSCVQSLVEFCRLNPGTIIEQDLPLPRKTYDGDKIFELEDRPLADVDPANALHPIAAQGLDRFIPFMLETNAAGMFESGEIKGALFNWALAYHLSNRGTSSLNSLLTFYGVVVDDFYPLRELLFRSSGVDIVGKKYFQVLADIFALEYEKNERLAGLPQFISQHEVYEVEAKEGLRNVHMIVKTSRQDAKERIELERRNLKVLEDELGAVEVMGSKFSLPAQIGIQGDYPQFSMLLEQFVTGSSTMDEVFLSESLLEKDRLKHVERLIAYTALLHRRGSKLFPGQAPTKVDYLQSFQAKLKKVDERLARNTGSELENLMIFLASNIAELPAEFYVNASPKNFLLVDGDTEQQYYKIDFESDEHRANFIDPVTLIYDTSANVSIYSNYLITLYDFLMTSDHDVMIEAHPFFSEFFARRDRGEYTSLEEASGFIEDYADLYQHSRLEYLFEMVDIVCLFRDMTIILDKSAENIRLEGAIASMPAVSRSVEETGKLERQILDNKYHITERMARVFEMSGEIGSYTPVQLFKEMGLA